MGILRGVSPRLAALVASLSLTIAAAAPALASSGDDRSLAKAADSLIELFTGAPAPAPASADHRASHSQKHASSKHASAPRHSAPAVAHVESKPAAQSPPPPKSQAGSAGSTASAASSAPVHATVAAAHPATHAEARHVAQAPSKPQKHTTKATAADDWLKDSGPAGDTGSGTH